jgi:hypothetical protein
MVRMATETMITPTETPTAMPIVLLFFFCTGVCDGLAASPEKSAVRVGSYQKFEKWVTLLLQTKTGTFNLNDPAGMSRKGMLKMTGALSRVRIPSSKKVKRIFKEMEMSPSCVCTPIDPVSFALVKDQSESRSVSTL